MTRVTITSSCYEVLAHAFSAVSVNTQNCFYDTQGVRFQERFKLVSIT